MSEPVPTKFEVAGHPLSCGVCAGDAFTARTITLTTSGFANSGLNKQVDAVTCAACGLIYQFVLGSAKPRDDIA